jgi:hypothetical protein
MTLNRIASAFVAILLVAPALFAAEDLTGKWSGSFIASMNGGAQETEGAYMVLKHAGKELTGTAGPSVDRQWPILKGTIVVSGNAPKGIDQGLVRCPVRRAAHALRARIDRRSLEGKRQGRAERHDDDRRD